MAERDRPTDAAFTRAEGSPDAAEAWEQFIVEQVYPEPQAKAREDYRNYDSPGRDTVPTVEPSR